MSVTFAPQLVGATSFAATCGCPGTFAHAPLFAAFELAHAAAEAANRAERHPLRGCDLPEVCPDYDLRAYPVTAEAEPEVNLHQGTALRVLELLGLAACAEVDAAHALFGGADPLGAVELAGKLDAQAFVGRALLALALTPADEGTDGYWSPSGRQFTGGRSAGRLQQVLGELHALGQWCLARGRTVTWG